MQRTQKNKSRRSRKERSYALRDSVAAVALPNRELTHSHVRTSAGFFATAAADSGQGIFFTLQGLPNYTEFTTLYDKYVIDKVDIIMVLSTEISAQSAAQAVYPVVQFSYDPDDATAPLSATQMLDRGNMEILAFGPNRTTFTRTVKPRIASAAYRGVATAGYSIAPAGTFVDSSSPDVQFFGARLWISNYNSVATPNTRINWYYRHYLRLRGTQ